MRRALCLAMALAMMTATARGNESEHAPALGAHVFLGQGEGIGSDPAVTPAMTTQTTGSIFLVLNAGYTSNDTTPIDTYRNHWKSLGKPMTYAGYGERFSVNAYIALAARGGPDHTVSIVKRGEPKGELSLPFIEIRNATRVQALAQNYAEPALQVASNEVHVDGPATLIAFWWGDGGVKRMTVTPGDGFTTIDGFVELPDESGVQGVVAWKQVTSAGTYRVHWTAAPVQGAALWLMAVR
jgi:hypothetical protein